MSKTLVLTEVQNGYTLTLGASHYVFTKYSELSGSFALASVISSIISLLCEDLDDVTRELNKITVKRYEPNGKVINLPSPKAF